jgi:hypothetical protein
MKRAWGYSVIEEGIPGNYKRPMILLYNSPENTKKTIWQTNV